MRRLVNATLVAGLIAGAGLAAAVAAVARHGMPGGTTSGTATTLAPSSHGMVIVDPETGVLGNAVGRELNRPATIEEAQAYARQIAAELVTETHADGSQSLIHDDRLADYAVIRITPGGELNFQCVHGDAAAHGALCAPRPTDSFLEVE